MSIQDSPALIGFLGFVIGLGVFVAWIKSGKKELLYLLAAVVLIFVALIVYERVTISDREAIEATLRHLAERLAANDHEEIFAAIHPSAPEHLDRAKSELPNYVFEECRITNIREIRVDASAKPKTAVAEFTVRAKGQIKLAEGGEVVRFIILNMELDKDGKWKVTNYEHKSFEEALKEQPKE
jgi:hypothetical protein